MMSPAERTAMKQDVSQRIQKLAGTMQVLAAVEREKLRTASATGSTAGGPEGGSRGSDGRAEPMTQVGAWGELLLVY